MRALVPVLTASLLATGCTAYIQSERRVKSPRREAADIAMGGVAQVVVGALVTVGSYYLYQHADPNPPRDSITGSHAGVAGVLIGSGLVISGIADGTIALYQVLSGDHLIPRSPPSPPSYFVAKPQTASSALPAIQGLNALVRTPLTP